MESLNVETYRKDAEIRSRTVTVILLLCSCHFSDARLLCRSDDTKIHFYRYTGILKTYNVKIGASLRIPTDYPS